MKRFILIITAMLIPFAVQAKDYINTAVRIDMEHGVILGVMEKDGKQELFNFDLKNADYNDGHTVVIYKKWLPDIPAGYGLRMHIAHPDDFMVVTESSRSLETKTGTQYEFDNPDGGTVMAFSDRWIKKTESYKKIDISTYFTKENVQYAPAYFARIKELLGVYTEKLGPYPFSSFNVVDVPYPVGHALVSMTFISGRIIGMPFLTDISLGHELVHQWVGVGVETRDDDGNWAEGLTTYLADRYYAEMKGEGAEYRKNSLLAYAAHAHQKEPGTCLTDFRYNSGKSAQAVGYAKGMMIFSMLETMMGQKDFDRGVKLFLSRNMYKKAGWDDITSAFETASGIILKDFMNGWLTETALAEFSVSDAKVDGELNGYSLTFKINNKYKSLEYPLDVIVKTGKGDVRDYVYVKGDGKTETIKTAGKPLKIILDPDYKAARLPSDAEAYPVMHHLFSKYKKTVFVNTDEQSVYDPVIQTLDSAEVVSDDANPYKYSGSIMVFMGKDNRAFRKFMRQEPEVSDADFMVKAYKHPLGISKMVYLIESAGLEASQANAGRIVHYGKYSELVSSGHGYEKTIDKAENGYSADIDYHSGGVALSRLLTIKDVAAANPDTKVFLMGENHGEYAHHENQYELIKALAESGRDVAVGLEYIQRPFQKYLDQYVNGEISEPDMLAKTEYYSRWRFDFRLYRKIFEYARDHHIKLIALNTEAEITKKVSMGGISSLSEEDLAKIPSDIEYTGGRYRDSLYEIFKMHEGERKFGNFYEAQLLWDETMAESAYNYLKEHPEKTLVILAGNGHISYRTGIADRLKRRGGYKDTVIVQDENEETGIGDYAFYPERMDYAESPKIGVMVDETAEGLLVKGVTKDSAAAKAGVLEGDYITDFNGVPVHDLAGIKIGLTYAEKGNSYNMKVKRAKEDVTLSVSF